MKITFHTADDLIWGLGLGDSTPYYRLGDHNSIKVDPYPAYAPDRALVEDLLAECVAAFPLTGAQRELAILSREFLDRVNGLTFDEHLWRHEDGSEWPKEKFEVAAPAEVTS